MVNARKLELLQKLIENGRACTNFFDFAPKDDNNHFTWVHIGKCLQTHHSIQIISKLLRSFQIFYICDWKDEQDIQITKSTRFQRKSYESIKLSQQRNPNRRGIWNSKRESVVYHVSAKCKCEVRIHNYRNTQLHKYTKTQIHKNRNT